VLARNTIEALQSGLVLGVAAQVDGLVARMIEELGERPADVTVIATGYLAPVVVEECRCFTENDNWLTIRGLELVFRRNA
jgi:type III pantothenate kinase